MPGVGVAPFGTAFALAGIPGVMFPDGGIGLVERPGGRLFASTFTNPAPAPFALEFAFALDSVDDPQADIKTDRDKREIIKTFDIKIKPLQI